jgi:hypothetical protein
MTQIWQSNRGRHRLARIRGLGPAATEPLTAAEACEEVVGIVTGCHIDVKTGDILMEIDLETPGEAAERVTREAVEGS